MAKRKATEERSSGPKSSATTGAAKALARSSRNAGHTGELEKIYYDKQSTYSGDAPSQGAQPAEG